MTTWWHEQRLEAAHKAVLDCGATDIVDLGCGDGDLLVRLAVEPHVRRITAIDLDRSVLDRLRVRLAALGALATAQIEIIQRSMTDGSGLRGFDCAILIETIEHIDPGQLSVLERAIFVHIRPQSVIVTTPNAEFNGLLGVPAHRFRHPGHRFEWDRAKFRSWANGVAARRGYGVACTNIAGAHPVLGGASQMAVFTAQ
ncbi:hypothetical protein GCM10011529_24890 [Polymorphobacter glacialis]|uniref:Small RNA 2'-O-methyltransferase n=1 Tax=Sandarakinorhabdus glacialis TaxID=1614636 RepID=A0A916ZWY5_9SPHN|nr:methyltransferase [Polymorphobacter glacialis]GGE17391.1 hypothetical protein GCM10011529_24890 [Polymorphobacter glacialis]